MPVEILCTNYNKYQYEFYDNFKVLMRIPYLRDIYSTTRGFPPGLSIKENFYRNKTILTYGKIFDYIKKMQVDGYLAGNFWAILAFFLDAVFR